MCEQSKVQMLECAYIHTDTVFKVHSLFFFFGLGYSSN